MFKLPGKDRRAGLLIEILMIVVGINVALWFESWFQELEDAETAEEYLLDLREDLLMDIGNLDRVIEFSEAKLRRTAKYIELLPQLAELPPDEQAQAIYTPAHYQLFVPSDATYRSMQESGDFRLLRDAEIKKSILRLDRRHQDIALAQKNYLQAMDDGYIPLMMTSFDIATMRVTDPTLFEDQLFRNFFVYTRQDTDSLASIYRRTRADSAELLRLIAAQLGEESPAEEAGTPAPH